MKTTLANGSSFLRYFLLTLSLLLLFPNVHLLAKTSPDEVKTYTVDELSQKIKSLQVYLKQKYGIKEIFISGGSSRALLDHIFQDRPLSMRDLDIAVIMDQDVTPEMAARIGADLESKSLGQFSSKDLRPRPRVNPSLTGPQRYSHNAGYGFFWL